MSARDDLADLFTGHPVGLGSPPNRLMRGHAQEIAEVILAAGYLKPETGIGGCGMRTLGEYKKDLICAWDEGRTAGQSPIAIPNPYEREPK